MNGLGQPSGDTSQSNDGDETAQEPQRDPGHPIEDANDASAGLWPVRALTNSERQLGVYVYGLIYSWRDWLHRRIEQIEFADPVTYLRRTSIDLTIPLLETPLARTDEKPLFCVPLALLKKRRLRKFSIRDQDGKSLPLLTQSKNGAVAVGVLTAAARQALQRAAPELAGALPTAIYDDLWEIVHRPSSEAIATWQHLGRHRGELDATEREWRDVLVGDEQFMALAADLARNFLVLTILAVDFAERRIVKFEYEQEGSKPSWVLRLKVRRVQRRLAQYKERRRDEREAEQAIRKGGRTIVRATATTRLFDPKTQQLSDKQVAQAGIELVIECPTGPVRAATRADGSATFAVPSGSGILDTVLPQGIVEEGDRPEGLALPRDGEVKVELRCRQVGPTPVIDEDDEVGPPATLWRLVTNSIGWRAKPVAILAPAVGQGMSYHLEIEAPEGLKITRCKLVERPSYATSDRPDHETGRQDFERGPLQRSHVHLGGVAQSASAVAVVHLRPRASVIVRAGTISALVTTVLLWIVARRQTHLLGVLGTVATLLLVVPGGLSAYVSRPRENSLTSSMVFGLRVLTMATGFISLIAAADVIFSRDWLIARDKTIKPGGEWAHASDLLWACFGGSLAIFAVMALTWFWTARMPERGHG